MKKSIIILPIMLLILSCSETKIHPVTNNTLASQIEYKEKTNSKVFFESDAYKMILFAMKKEQALKPHSAPMDTPLLILEGEAKITIDQKIHILNKGESIILPKNIDHAVYPISDIKFVLVK